MFILYVDVNPTRFEPAKATRAEWEEIWAWRKRMNEAVAAKAPPKLAAVWIADVLKGELNYRNLDIDSFRQEDMIEIVNMLADSRITEDGAVEIIRDLLDKKGESPEEILKSKGLGKAEDDAVQKAVREAVKENAPAVADYKAGSERALNFIVGQVMKKTKGKASPGEVHKLVKAEVESQVIQTK